MADQTESTSPPSANQQGDLNIASGDDTTVGGSVVGRDKITNQITNNIAAVPVGVEALHQLPSAPPDFIGRTRELKKLLRAVQSGGATILGLHGQGGIGKTVLALKLAEA